MNRPVRAILFALGNGATIAALTTAALMLRDMAFGTRALTLVAAFAAGGGLGGLLAPGLADGLAAGRAPLKRFAAMLVALPLLTLAGIEACLLLLSTGCLTTFEEPVLSGDWLMAVGFAGATNGFVLFAVGLPLVLPAGIVPLFAAAIVFARLPRG